MDESNSPASKVCRRCEHTLPAASFSPSARNRDGLRSYCRACEAARRRERRSANLESERARDREIARARYRANPEPFREKSRAVYKADPEKQLALVRDWQRRYPEKVIAADRRWYEANREKVAGYGRKRRALQLGATVGIIDLKALWTGSCGICNEPIDPAIGYPDPRSKSVDHIIPLVLGGSHEQSNLQWSHLRCNLKKGDRPTT